MRAEKMKERPSFSLMKQTDIQNLYYMQMPRWLFSDPRYAGMSLDAKVAYTFLLNQFQLSRRKGWINEQGEVFVIFPRLELAKELRVCEKRVTPPSAPWPADGSSGKSGAAGATPIRSTLPRWSP